jgi:hypothetical protein
MLLKMKDHLPLEEKLLIESPFLLLSHAATFASRSHSASVLYQTEVGVPLISSANR